MGICCTKSRENKKQAKVSRHVSLRPEQAKEKSTDCRLMSLNPADVVDVPHKGEYIRIRIIKVYDGDTVTFIFLHGGEYPLKFRMRIINIDAPEIKGPRVSDLHSEAGKAVRDVVEKLINNQVVWAKFDKWDKYGGRVDGDIFFDHHNVDYSNDIGEWGIPLSSWLIQEKLAHEYSGKEARDEWDDEEFQYIISKSNKLLKDLDHYGPKPAL